MPPRTNGKIIPVIAPVVADSDIEVKNGKSYTSMPSRITPNPKINAKIARNIIEIYEDFDDCELDTVFFIFYSLLIYIFLEFRLINRSTDNLNYFTLFILFLIFSTLSFSPSLSNMDKPDIVEIPNIKAYTKST